MQKRTSTGRTDNGRQPYMYIEPMIRLLVAPRRPSSLSLHASALALALALIMLSGATPALAALGQPLPAPAVRALSSTPAASSPAATTAASSTLYSQVSDTLPNGSVVTQYANSQQVVFAVHWQGRVLPDLAVLLGSYFPAFKAQASSSRATRSVGAPLHLASASLVVQSIGRMGNFSGFAYAPALVPPGLDMRHVLP